MKALAIDSAVSKLTIAAKNEDKTCTTIFNIGMKQSETLLPAIDYVLSKVGLTPADLDYLTLTQGPGSFTGLRLAYSALKAIECAFNTPIYGISSLIIHSFPLFELSSQNILSCIDANKDRFYANISIKSKTILEDGDYTIEEIKNKVENLDSVLICGPDKEKLFNEFQLSGIKNITLSNGSFVTTDTMFKIAEQMISENQSPLKDFDGPVYLRVSEAEQVLKSKENN